MPRRHSSVGSGSGLCPGSSETFLKSVTGASSVPHHCRCIPSFAVSPVSVLPREQHHVVALWLAEHGARQVETAQKRVRNLFCPGRCWRRVLLRGVAEDEGWAEAWREDGGS